MEKVEIAVFGGGCFWCTEAIFQRLKGVVSVMSGYAGGHLKNPSYHQVSSGKSGHAEVIKITFDPAHISYKDLLTVFFASHDPTTPNRQGNDVGPQYRSIILYANEEQRITAEEFIEGIDQSSGKGDAVVTEVRPLEGFYEAEEEHKQFYQRNPNQSYCQLVINPKLEKVQKEFAQLLTSTSQV